METSIEIVTSIIKKWNLWCLNYDSSLRWIHDIWDSVGLGDHLVEKFRNAQKYYEAGAMLIFWADLDEQNREKLLTWVMDNYKG